NAWPAGVALSTPTSGPVVGDGGVFGVIQSSGQKSQLIRIDATDGTQIALSAELSGSAFSSNSAPSPVLGTQNMVYVVDEVGALFVVNSRFGTGAVADWQASLPAPVGGTVTASPTLDCNRLKPSSQTGVLYIATQSGWLISYLVDSPGGLD